MTSPAFSVPVPVKYQETIDRIRAGRLSRTDLLKLRSNALDLLARGNADAQRVVDAIDIASPMDQTMVFMGFCPDADLRNRLDTAWRAQGVCTFDYVESLVQLQRFNGIWPGDLVILKKREVFGKTMRLFGHGRVTGIGHDEKGLRYLQMAWSTQEEIIEVPLMACNSTVDVKDLAQVAAEMPEAFYTWLGFAAQPA